MSLFDKLVKRTSEAGTTGTARMTPIVGPTKFAPRKAAPRYDPAEDTLSGVTLQVHESDGSDPYNAHSDAHRIR